jgi:uncharacterized membrane protein YedE/YeeE
MDIVNFTPVPALLGGIVIGLSAVMVLYLNGRIAGISGIVARVFRRVPGDTAWRVLFLLGMVAGGAATFAVAPQTADFTGLPSWGFVLAAGFLVGVGTRIGGGCTSGHGVCGLARGSGQSLVAVLTFMAAGMVTVYVVRHVLGGGVA